MTLCSVWREISAFVEHRYIMVFWRNLLLNKSPYFICYILIVLFDMSFTRLMVLINVIFWLIMKDHHGGASWFRISLSGGTSTKYLPKILVSIMCTIYSQYRGQIIKYDKKFNQKNAFNLFIGWFRVLILPLIFVGA